MSNRPTIPLFKVLMDPRATEEVARVLTSGYIGQGEQVERFEAAFGEAIGASEPPLSLSSGTAALDLALHLCGINATDRPTGGKTIVTPAGTTMVPHQWEVITTPITCTATNAPIALRGARIVWADVDPVTGNIDPEDVARKITPRTKAIMAVDWAGRACDYERLDYDTIPVIEDAAHAFMARYLDASIVRTGGDYVCHSFQAIKHLTTGDGGALTCLLGDTERGRLLRWYGLDRRSSQDFRCAQNIREIGWKAHMNDIAATIGLANLELAKKAVQTCRDNAAYYDRALAGIAGVTLPPPDPGCSYWLYTVLVEDRDSFAAFLAARGIATSQVHARNDKHDAFRAVSTSGPLPGVDHFDAHQVSIPVGWWVTLSDLKRIVGAVYDWAAIRSRARAPRRELAAALPGAVDA